MTTGWRRLRVGDLVRDGVLAVSDGYRMRNEELGAVGVPFVRGGDIRDGWIDTNVSDHIRPEFADLIAPKLTRPGDVAFITKGTVGRAGFLRPEQPPVVFAPQVAWWRVLDTNVLEPRFIYYLFQTADFRASLDAVKSHGAMVADYVSISQQQDFRLMFPPIREQRAIARILGALDDKIESNRRTNHTLEAMARALFKSWFVDFDPVHAKMEGHAPAGMDSATASLFPERFNGATPKGWSAVALYSIATFVNGGAYRDEDFVDSSIGLPVVKIAELKSGVIDQTRYSIPGKSREVRIDSGDMLLSWSGNPDTSIGTFFWVSGPALLNQHIFKVEFLDDVERVWGWCLLENLRPVLADLARGKQTTGLGHFTIADMKRLLVIRPSRECLTVFHRTVNPLLRRHLQHFHESRTLAALRDALLPRLLSGELRVRDAERLAVHAL